MGVISIRNEVVVVACLEVSQYSSGESDRNLTNTGGNPVEL
jgi:hypothetical protein